MSKMRGIKPEFWSSEQIVNCSPLARLLFIGMWNFCDDAGIHPASIKRLKMEVFPADDFTIEQINQWVAELIDNKLLRQYNADDGDYWMVTGWHHQKINRPYYKYPKEKHCSSTVQTVPEQCLNMTETKRNETNRNEYETKRNEIAAPKKIEELMDKVKIAFQTANEMHPTLLHDGSGVIQQWLNNGMDLEMDILPTMKTIITKANTDKKEIGSFSYFTKAIADANATRNAQMPVGQAKQTNSYDSEPYVSPHQTKIKKPHIC